MQTENIDAVAGPSGESQPGQRRGALLIDALPQSATKPQQALRELDGGAKARLLEGFWDVVDAA